MSKVCFSLFIDDELRRDFKIEATILGLKPNQLFEHIFVEYLKRKERNGR